MFLFIHLHFNLSLSLKKKSCNVTSGSFVVLVAAGEALEAELNAAGPGTCKFVSCDMSKEEDIKVDLENSRAPESDVVPVKSRLVC